MLYRLIRLNGSLSDHERNVLYWNRGDGSFADLSAVAGLDFPEDGRAFVTFDFDHVGDTDILLNNGIPDGYKGGIAAIADKEFSYMDYSVRTIVESTQQRAIAMVERHGGHLEGDRLLVKTNDGAGHA